MNTRWIGAAVGGAAIGLMAVGAVLVADHHQPGTAIAAVPPTTQTPGVVVGRTITVNGNGSLTVKPDTATIGIGVQATASTATAALNQANAAANALLAAVKGAGVAGDDIVTSGVSVYPMYSGNNHITGYQASNSVTITVRSIDHTGPVIDVAAKAAGDNVTISGISFSVADPEAVIGKARAKAIDNATARAGQYAAAAGVKVGQVVQISEVSVGPMPIYYAEQSGAVKDASFTPIQSGTQDMSVSVTVVFALQ